MWEKLAERGLWAGSRLAGGPVPPRRAAPRDFFHGLLALVLAVAFAPGLQATATGSAPTQPPTPKPKPNPNPTLTLTGYDHLPFRFAVRAFEGLEVRYHERSDLAPAYYQPEVPSVGADTGSLSATGEIAKELFQSAGAGDGATVTGPGGETGEGALPLRSARLVLSRDSFPDPAVLAVVTLPIDSVEYLSYALLVAHLYHEALTETIYGESLRSKAGIPAGERALASEGSSQLAEEILSLASFGSHLLSLANEIERLERRRVARGDRGLCSLIDRRIGLFMIWERAFEGDYVTSIPGPRGVLRSVGAEAKRVFLEQVLEGRWQGDAVADFGARYCRRIE